jgi:hypothetical protein
MKSINHFKEKIKTAKKEITIIGIVNLGVEFDFNDCIKELSIFLSENKSAKLKILYEYDDLLFAYSLSTDIAHAEKRVSYDDLKFKSTLVSKLKDKLVKENSNTSIGERISVKQMYLPIHLNVVKFDNETYIRPSLDGIGNFSEYKLLNTNDVWNLAITNYISNYFDDSRAGKYSALADEEVLELYDSMRIPRGSFPRKSFYDTDYNQYVIWAFVFDRKGNLLIHKRKENAKDNQGMWDKSVGGHIDFTKELNSDKAAVRELAEELYGDEGNENIISVLSPDGKNAIFLGDYRPEFREFHPMDEIKSLGKSIWAYFRIPIQLQINTPRILPKGKGVRKLQVIVDPFIFIAIKEFKINDLKNSDYMMISMSDLKTAVEKEKFEIDGKTVNFIPSPDLKTIMSGKLRQILTEASNQVNYTFK